MPLVFLFVYADCLLCGCSYALRNDIRFHPLSKTISEMRTPFKKKYYHPILASHFLLLQNDYVLMCATIISSYLHPYIPTAAVVGFSPDSYTVMEGVNDVAQVRVIVISGILGLNLPLLVRTPNLDTNTATGM